MQVPSLRDALCLQKGVVRTARELLGVGKNGYKQNVHIKTVRVGGGGGANPRQLVVRSNTLVRPILTLMILLFSCYSFLLFFPETIN